MTDFATLLERNRAFTQQYENNLSILPRIPTFVLTCVDARVDPAHYLGLQLGDAIVLRNAGARVTGDVEVEIGVLSTLAERMLGDKFTGVSLAIIHHNDCGYERLANPELRALMHKKLGLADEVLQSMAISDHVQAIKDDIVRLQQSSLVPDAATVTGYMYDVHSGQVREVVPQVRLNAIGE